MKRWLLWTFRCGRGRACADLVIDEIDEDTPEGWILRLSYVCAGCGTAYTTTALVGRHGTYTQVDRVRARERSSPYI